MVDEYGIHIESQEGKLIISNEGILQVWGDTVSNYCQKTTTETYPLSIYLYIPNNLITLNNIKLCVFVDNFKHYIKTLESVNISLSTPANTSHVHSVSKAIGTYTTSGSYTARTVSGHVWYDGYITTTGTHTHSVGRSISSAGSHSHTAISHTHPITPGINIINTTNVTGITGTIQKIGISNTTSINFIQTYNYFVNSTNLITNFFNNLTTLSGWYIIQITSSNNTTKKLITTYTIEGMMGVLHYV